MNFRKKYLWKILNYHFGGIWTPDLCWSFATNTELSYLVSLDWNLSPDLFYSFTKEQLLIYSIKGDWAVFYNISMTSICQDSVPISVEHYHTKYKSASMQIQKPRHLRPPHANLINFSISKLKSSQVRFPTLKWSQHRSPKKKVGHFWCLHKNQAICGPHPKLSQFRQLPPTQKTTQSIITLKTSYFGSAHG